MRPVLADHDLALPGHLAPALAALALVMACMLGVRLAQPTVSDRATSPARVAASTERIDPNTAGPESLRRLPNLGPTRVNAIIAYRQTNGPVPFRNAADLTKVHGIGPTIAASLDEYLEFPEQP